MFDRGMVLNDEESYPGKGRVGEKLDPLFFWQGKLSGRGGETGKIFAQDNFFNILERFKPDIAVGIKMSWRKYETTL